MRPSAGTPDRIELRGLRVVASHGVLPEEHERPQPFEADIDLLADIAAAGESDSLDDTVDYGAVTAAAAAALGAPHAELLEHLASRVAAAVLDAAGRRGVEAVVTVRKLRPPVPHDLASGAVTVRRRGRQTAYLALGSNLGDRRATLRDAVASLDDVDAVSPVYETDPVGGPGGQQPFLNCVVRLRTATSAEGLLGVCRRAEAAAGRVRAERWGPRTLDVDVLLVGDRVVVTPELTVPHPRMFTRGFVLVPLADLAPELAGPHLTPELREGVRPAGHLGDAE